MEKYKDKTKHQRSIKFTHTLKDAYKKYIEKYHKKGTKRKYKITDYTKIVTRVNELLSTKIVTESFNLKLPKGLGFVFITKKEFKIPVDEDGKLKKHRLIIDWDATWDYWYTKYGTTDRKVINDIPNKTVVYNYNQHTDNFIMRYYWDKNTNPLKNKSVYKFRPLKGGVKDNDIYYGRLGLAAWLKNPLRNNDYYKR